jgi:hypothetical protein
MQSGRLQRLRTFASSLMLLAIVAFVQQTTMITLSQVAAALGSMPQPAVSLYGALHLHDNLAGHVHAHGGDHAVGHVHGSSDPDDDHSDELGKAPFWSIGCTTAFISGLGLWTAPLHVAGIVQSMPNNVLDGIEPDGLSRPPSIPGIA